MGARPKEELAGRICHWRGSNIPVVLVRDSIPLSRKRPSPQRYSGHSDFIHLSRPTNERSCLSGAPVQRLRKPVLAGRVAGVFALEGSLSTDPGARFVAL